MTRPRILGLILAAALAVGCGPPAKKMGVALPTSPPQFQVIPAGTNPNTLGIPGAVGNRVQNSGGGQCWVMAPGGTWVADPPPGGTADGGFSFSLSSLAAQAPSTVVGVAADGGTVPPSALTQAQLTALVKTATPSAAGLMSAAQVLALSGLQPSKTPGSTLFAFTDVIDLTVTGTYVLLPPVGARLDDIAFRFEIKTSTGASVGPTWSMGSNSASFNNVYASQTTAALTSQAAETLVAATPVNPVPCVDLTANGLQIVVTGGATATALTARGIASYALLPF